MFYRFLLSALIIFNSLKSLETVSAIDSEYAQAARLDILLSEADKVPSKAILMPEHSLSLEGTQLSSLFKIIKYDSCGVPKKVPLISLDSDLARDERVTNYVNTNYNSYAQYLPLFLESVNNDWVVCKTGLKILAIPDELVDYLYKEHRNKQNRVYYHNRKVNSSVKNLLTLKRFNAKFFKDHPEALQFKDCIISSSGEVMPYKNYNLDKDSKALVVALRKLYKARLRRTNIQH